MGKLQTDKKICGILARFDMPLDDFFTQGNKIGKILLLNNELIGVGPAVMPDSNSFTPPDKLCATQAEPAPASANKIVWPAIGFRIPAFHGQDGKAIAHGFRARKKRFAQWRNIPG